ncbi:MAG: AMP-binding protein, partial [Betaproteobacteria bacterium]
MTINAAALLLDGHDATAVALVCGDDQMTYGTLRERVARAAAAWRAAGVAIGDRVAIALPDNLDWVVAYLGVIWAGGVAVAVNPRVPPDEWNTIVGAAGFRCILAATPIATPPACKARMLAVDDWRGLVAGAPAVAPCMMEDHAAAFWSHSSGSSGSPKAVVHAHRFARHVADVASDVLDVHIGDRLFASSRMFFVYPLGNSLFAGLKLGATIILDPQWPTAATVAATVAIARPSIFFSVPSMYRSLLRDGFATVFAHNGVR